MLGLGLGLTLGHQLGNALSAPAGYVELLGRRPDDSHGALKGRVPYEGVTALYGKVA